MISKSKAVSVKMLIDAGMSPGLVATKLGVKESSIERYVRMAKEPPRDAKIFLVDIETSLMETYVWGLYKQRIPPKNIKKDWNIICWAGKMLYEPEIISDVVTSRESIKGNDRRILKHLWVTMNKADIVIAHNAVQFDVRKINDRFLEYDFPPPRPYQVVDTLRASRKMFHSSSHQLAYFSKRFKLSEKLGTEFELWPRCMEGDQKSLDYMSKYNIHDVLALEDWYIKIRPWIPGHPNVVLYGGDITDMRCTRCGSYDLKKDGMYLTPAGRYQAYRCKHCKAFSRSRYADLTKEDRRNLLVPTAR